MKTSLKARYEPDKVTAAATVTVHAGDVKLRASITDATVVNGPNLNGLVLAVERPGFFIADFNVPKKDFRFQFMNTIRVAEKPLNLTYTHCKGDERTTLDGSLVIDPENKVSVNYVLGMGDAKFKYTYIHGGLTTIEPCYFLGKNAWEFAVSRKVYEDDVFRATYQASSKNFGLEWTRSSKVNGSFKVIASMNLADEKKVPKLAVETTWDFEM